MTIAELFVNLGIKGDGSAKKALGGVKTGLGEVRSMSLEAKAAIIGAIYALERMMTSSMGAGTGFMNFASLTGLSAQELQKWQYAARQVGVEGAELEGSIKAVQTSMTNMLLGKGKPEGMAMLANKVGFDMNKARDTFYVMQQLQKFVQQVPADVGANLAKSFGLSDNIISAMQRNAFRPDVFAKAPTYSDNEISNLNRAQVIWSNLGNKVQMAFGRFTAKHGPGIAGDVSTLVDKILLLSEALVRLSEKLEIFKAIGKSIEGMAMIADLITGKDKKTDTSFGGFVEAWKGSNIESGEKQKAYGDQMLADFMAKRAGEKAGSQTINNVNVNQNLNFQHDGKDAKKTGDSAAKGVKNAIRQSSALKGGI